ncbi:MAG: alpha/beta fold hydrolase [Caldilineaceae bacterium]|nr:alpha/beta fold hydrolase [Caldilineaceae bacterium]
MLINHPITDFATARAQVAVLQAQDDAGVNPVCATRLLDHGKRTHRVIVCYHGYTNCPAQFQTLAEELHRAGHTVFVPRLPYHGLSDRMTTEHARLTAADLVAFTNETIDIACGLGEEIVLTGLSAGAIMAAWAAQFRPEVHTAVVAAPSLGLPGWPLWASDATARLMHYIPNLFIWWDQKAKSKIAGAPQAYPRFATRALGEIMAMGRQVRRAARTSPPVAQQVTLLLSDSDVAVHHGVVAQLAHDWQHHAPDRVTFQRFPAHLRIHHDMVDPTQPAQRVDLVYPVWCALCDGETTTTTI